VALEVNTMVNGAPLDKIQQLRGHIGAKTTTIYGDATGADEEGMRRLNG
jgi:hypothetical protein